jgi:hypothetical protein
VRRNFGVLIGNSAVELLLGEIGVPKVRTFQIRTSEVGVRQMGSFQVSGPQIGPFQVSVVQMGPV